MAKVSERDRIAALEVKLKGVATESRSPGRREAVLGGCGRTVLVRTPRTTSSRPHSCWEEEAHG